MPATQASLSVNIAFDQCGLFFVTSPDVKGMLIAAKGLDEAAVKIASCLRDFAELDDPFCKAFLAATHDPSNPHRIDQRIARVAEVLINRLPFTDAQDDMQDLARVVVALSVETRAEPRLEALKAVAKAYEAWEADLVFEGNWNNGLPALTQPLFDGLLEIQAMRNAALSAVPTPREERAQTRREGEN